MLRRPAAAESRPQDYLYDPCYRVSSRRDHVRGIVQSQAFKTTLTPVTFHSAFSALARYRSQALKVTPLPRDPNLGQIRIPTAKPVTRADVLGARLFHHLKTQPLRNDFNTASELTAARHKKRSASDAKAFQNDQDVAGAYWEEYGIALPEVVEVTFESDKCKGNKAVQTRANDKDIQTDFFDAYGGKRAGQSLLGSQAETSNLGTEDLDATLSPSPIDGQRGKLQALHEHLSKWHREDIELRNHSLNVLFHTKKAEHKAFRANMAGKKQKDLMRIWRKERGGGTTGGEKSLYLKELLGNKLDYLRGMRCEIFNRQKFPREGELAEQEVTDTDVLEKMTSILRKGSDKPGNVMPRPSPIYDELLGKLRVMKDRPDHLKLKEVDFESLKCCKKIEEIAPRPVTPTLPPKDYRSQAQRSKYKAATLLQRLLRGRATQLAILQGLQHDFLLLAELRARRANPKPEIPSGIFARTPPERLAERQQESASFIGSALDYLTKEIARINEKRRIDKLVEDCDRLRLSREAAELESRRREEERRTFNDELYRMHMNINQETLDSWLMEVMDDAVEMRSEVIAHEIALDNAKTIYHKTPRTEESDIEQQVKDMVESFLVPEVERRAARRELAEAQHAYLMAAHGALIATLNGPEAKELEKLN